MLFQLLYKFRVYNSDLVEAINTSVFAFFEPRNPNILRYSSRLLAFRAKV